MMAAPTKKEIAAMRKVMSTPRSPLNDFSTPVMDMSKVHGSPGGIIEDTSDPLAKIQREEANDAYTEYRELRAMEKTMNLKKRSAQLKKQIEAGTPRTTTPLSQQFSAADLQQISQMGDAEKAKFFETVQRINMISAMQNTGPGGQGAMNPVLAMMMGGGFGGGGFGAKDFIEMGNMWNTIYKGAGRGNENITDQLLLTLMSNTIPNLRNQAMANQAMAYQTQIAHLQQNQSDPMKDLRYMKEMAGEMGWKPGSMSDSVAMERLKMENTWRQRQWEFDKEELNQRKTMGYIQQILREAPKALGTVRSMARKEVSNIVEKVRTAPVETQEPQPQQRPQPQMGAQQRPAGGGRLVQYTCTACQSAMLAPEGQPIVFCPSCGKEHTTTYSQGR